jgi:hypothetical protein
MAERITHTEMAYELAKLVYGKLDWLQRFASGKSKRGDHEIELKRRELAVLQQAKEDYQNAAERAA